MPETDVATAHTRCTSRDPLVNLLIGSSQRASRPARENEGVLNGADGLDWETLVQCDLMYLVAMERLYRRRGNVGTALRRALVQRINACFGFTLV